MQRLLSAFVVVVALSAAVVVATRVPPSSPSSSSSSSSSSFTAPLLAPKCPTHSLPVHERLACTSFWKFDLTRSACEARGCCWSPLFDVDPLTWCHYATAKSAVARVHVVQGCHFDAGFAYTLPAIINKWWHVYFPLARAVGEALAARRDASNARLQFTAQSWLVALFVHCPTAYAAEGVRCPNATEIAAFRDSVAKGYVTWHAMPFNGELEVADAPLVDYALSMTHTLDAYFGVAPKRVMSQRDVPGTTRGAIAALRARNISALSVGVNGGSTPPNVPHAFVWRDAESGEQLRTFYVQGGYGGTQLPALDYYTYTALPGSTDVMVVHWRGDNSGPPPTADDVVSTFNKLAVEFPHARIESSTFDAFVEATADAPLDALPTFDAEIGDTWIYGIASAPVKLARFRRLLVARAAVDAAASSSPSSPSSPSSSPSSSSSSPSAPFSSASFSSSSSASSSSFSMFSTIALKNFEHTWGEDQKTFARTAVAGNWSNGALRRMRAESSEWQAYAESWERQLRMGQQAAIDSLPVDSPLRAPIERALASCMPIDASAPPLPPSQYTHYAPLQLPAGGFRFDDGLQLRIDARTGAIVELANCTSSSSSSSSSSSCMSSPYASVTQPLGLLHYRTYDDADYTRFALDYNAFFGTVDREDFIKLNLDNSGARQRRIDATLVGAWFAHDARSLVLQLSLDATDASAVSDAGAPRAVFVTVRGGYLDATRGDVLPEYFSHSRNRSRRCDREHERCRSGAAVRSRSALSIEMQLLNKTITRMPEALFYAFAPPAEPASVWRVRKLDADVDPANVVVGGSKHLHSVDAHGYGVAYGAGAASPQRSPALTVYPLDASLVSFGGYDAHSSSVLHDTPLFDAFPIPIDRAPGVFANAEQQRTAERHRARVATDTRHRQHDRRHRLHRRRVHVRDDNNSTNLAPPAVDAPVAASFVLYDNLWNTNYIMASAYDHVPAAQPDAGAALLYRWQLEF